MTIEPQAFWTLFGGSIVGVIGVIVYVVRSASDVRKDTATSRNKQQTTATDAIASTLTSVVILLKDAIDNLAKANEIASRERGETSTVLREMMGHINGVYSVIKVSNDKTSALALSFDDMEREVAAARVDIGAVKDVTSSLETDIGENFTQQIAPVVVAIQGVADQLGKLNTSIQSKDGEILALIHNLQFGVGALETTLLKFLESTALKTLGEMNEKHFENGASITGASRPTAE